jgi:hypothetical protein
MTLSGAQAERLRTLYRRELPSGVMPESFKVSRDRSNRYKVRPFLAVDGEGIQKPDGTQAYALLVAADSRGNCWHKANEDGLTAEQCLRFLLDLPDRYTLISFFFNYDVSMMLKDLPPLVLRGLVDHIDDLDGPRVPWNDWLLEWLPSKWFSFFHEPLRANRKIYDTAGFFQMSLLKALEAWEVGTEDERKIIGMGKGQRELFNIVDDELIRYSVTECKLLSSMMDRVREECIGLGYHLRSYAGAGALANAMLAKHRVHEYKQDISKSLQDKAARAYFGGRFELTAHGYLDGPIYEYDINSAYPYVCSTLPCLLHGKWKRCDWPPPEGVRGLFPVEWLLPFDKSCQFTRLGWGPLPYRNAKSTITYSQLGKGWYWDGEIASALKAWPDNITVGNGYIWEQECDHKPFGFVPDMYERRQQLKAEGHRGERVLKLGLNSLYGKTAQTVGKPRYSNIVWAGLITSDTRARLHDAILLGGNDSNGYPNVIMAATDAVYSRVPLDLPIGKGLGEWELSTFDDILLVQPGLYAKNLSTDNPTTRTRGIRKASFSPLVALEAWREDGVKAGAFHVPLHTFVGIRRGLISKDLSIGTWADETRRIQFQPVSKRWLSGQKGPYSEILLLGTVNGFKYDIRGNEVISMSCSQSTPYKPMELKALNVNVHAIIDSEQPNSTIHQLAGFEVNERLLPEVMQ